MPLSERDRGTLRGWFERAVRACGLDPQAFDFPSEIDSSLTYAENKARLSHLLDMSGCAQRGPGARQVSAQARASEIAARSCPSCGLDLEFNRKKLDMQTFILLKAHLAHTKKGDRETVPGEPEREQLSAAEFAELSGME